VGSLHTLGRLTPLLILTILILLPPAISQTALSVTVSTNKTQYSIGETVAISGTVHDNQNNPIFGAGVSIQVNDPSAKIVHVQIVYTDQSGAYTDQFIIATSSQSGLYTFYVTASKSGYSNAQNHAQFSVSGTTSSSSTITTSSTSTGILGKCLIATASYGSELSPEVSTLRNLRDNEILKTSAGTYFIKAFNAFYYSFSPQAASYISSNNNIRTITKTLLYPLVGILYLSSIVFAATSFNGEFAVTVAGMFASISLGAVYVGPIITALSRFFKKSQSFRFADPIRIVLTMLTVSLISLWFAETVQLAALLTAAAVGTVLSCIVLGSLLVPWILTRSPE
jgi:hypothetical protein